MNPSAGKLSLKEKIGYSAGDAASNFFWQTFVFYLTMFYTDVFGLAPAAIAVMFLATKIWDAVNDPVMGLLADRTETRWGKFRPWLLWFALPLAVLGVLTFTTPNFSASGKLIYAYVTYTMLMMAYTIVNVPYSALMGVMTPNSHERTVLSSFRFLAAFLATLLVQYCMLSLVETFGKGNDVVGWQWGMGIFSAAAAVLLLITFATTKERVHPPRGQRSSFRRDLRDLATNKPWLIIGSATLFQLMYVCMRGGAIAYYFKYFVKNQSILWWESVSWEQLSSIFLVSGTIATLIGVMLTTRISRTLGSAKTYAFFLALAGLVTAGYFFLDPQDVMFMFVLQIVLSFAMGPVAVLQWAIYADTADYSEWVNRRRATGLTMSASLFALKMGAAIGGSALAWTLGAYGFEANVDQDEQALLAIRLVNSLYPAIFALMGVGVMLFYPLNKTKMAQIEADLIQRRREQEA